jgi:hypothetical protein
MGLGSASLSGESEAGYNRSGASHSSNPSCCEISRGLEHCGQRASEYRQLIRDASSFTVYECNKSASTRAAQTSQSRSSSTSHSMSVLCAYLEFDRRASVSSRSELCVQHPLSRPCLAIFLERRPASSSTLPCARSVCNAMLACHQPQAEPPNVLIWIRERWSV